MNRSTFCAILVTVVALFAVTPASGNIIDDCSKETDPDRLLTLNKKLKGGVESLLSATMERWPLGEGWVFSWTPVDSVEKGGATSLLRRCYVQPTNLEARWLPDENRIQICLVGLTPDDGLVEVKYCFDRVAPSMSE